MTAAGPEPGWSGQVKHRGFRRGPVTRARAPWRDLEIDDRIPISWLHLDRLAPNALPGESEGLFEGTLRLASPPRGTPVSRTSSLTVKVDGVLTTYGRTSSRPYPWRVRSAKRAEQSTAGLGTASAAPAALIVSEPLAR